MAAVSVTGAILVGGPNAELSGTLKSLLPIGGEPLIQRQIREMRALCSEVIVVTNTPKPFYGVIDSSVRLITDFFPDCGPLGGIHAALHLARHKDVWIAGGNMPLLSAEAAKRLLSRRDDSCSAAVPIVRGRPLPLHALYDKKCAENAARMLSNGQTRLESFLEGIVWHAEPADEWMKEIGIGAFDSTIDGLDDYERVCELADHGFHSIG